MSKMPDAQIATVNGLKLAYYEWGDDQLPSLICLHRHTNSAASWREFAEFASNLRPFHENEVSRGAGRGHLAGMRRTAARTCIYARTWQELARMFNTAAPLRGAPDPVALRAISATMPGDVWLVGWWLGRFTCKSTSQPAKQ